MSIKQTFEIVNGVYIGPEHWEGDLDLREYRDTITSLGNLEKVEGLLLEGCSSLTNLGNLETVGLWVGLRGCSSLTTLGDLETVGDFLDLEGCSSLTNLGNLEKVGEYLDLRGCSNLKTLGNLKTVSKNTYLNGYTGVSLEEVQEKIKYYSSLPAHEALNAIHIQEVQEVPLYRNILTGVLQRGEVLHI